MNRPNVNWITVFGLGHRWPASGTWGSLPPVLLAGVFFFVARGLGPEHASLMRGVYVLALLVVFAAFCFACVSEGEAAEARFGEKDPSQAVADETAGQCLPLLVLPVVYESWGEALLALLTAFVAFRVMDIVKPPPARGLQRLVGGWGILVDDLIAGIYAAVVTWVALLWM